MFVESIKTRFSDTDALGHINNTMLPIWFEGARNPIFELFTPNLDIQKWKLILARFEIEFHGEIFYGQDVEIRTGISRVGSSSFDVYQEAWQSEKRVASGKTVHVYFNYDAKRAEPLTDELKAALLAYPLGQD